MNNLNNDCFVIIIGESGAGKSTFINYVANAFHKRSSLSSLQVVIPNEHYPNSSSNRWKHNERSLDDPTLSKTIDCQHYSFPLPIGKGSLIFIDTPGLGDTNGYLQDNENVNKIFKTIKSLQQISAIILVINGTMPRMTSNIINVLTRFRQFFPDSIYTNMIVVFTNCQKYNVSFELDSLNLPSTCHFYYMQNSAFCQTPQMLNKHRDHFKQEWKESLTTMQIIIDHLIQLQPQTTKDFADLNDERYLLQTLLHELHLMIFEMDDIENELESLKKAREIAEENIQKLLQTNQIHVSTSAATNYNNMTCGKCNRVCDKNVKFNEVSYSNGNPVVTSSKMKGDRCIECGCSIGAHYCNVGNTVKRAQSIPGPVAQAQRRLRIEQEDHDLIVCKHIAVDTDKIQVKARFDRQCVQVRQTCMNLKKSCQSINIAQEATDFIQTLNQDRLQLRSPFAVTQLNYAIQELEQIVLDCQPVSSKNSDAKLRRDTQVVALVPAAPPVPRRQTITQGIPLMPPSHYQSAQRSGQSPTPRTGEELPLHPQRYSAFSTERLIGAHQEVVLINADYAKRTLYELEQRAKGSSVGLLTQLELVQFANHYADWRHHDKNDLQEEYNTLAKKIDLDTNRDPSNLDRVEPDDLLKIAALFLLISPQK